MKYYSQLLKSCSRSEDFEFKDEVKEAEIFCIDYGEWSDCANDEGGLIHQADEEVQEFDCPFSNFSLETFSGRTSLDLGFFDFAEAVTTHYGKEENYSFRPYCYWFYEVSPRVYRGFAFNRIYRPEDLDMAYEIFTQKVGEKCPISDSSQLPAYFLDLLGVDYGTLFEEIDGGEVNLILENLTKILNNKKNIGVEGIRKSIKISKDERLRVKRVCYIASQEYRKDNILPSGNIDFSHRFFVRGHWREINEKSLGKNRAGDYCVPGMTWVTEFQKGSKDKDLIRKTRVVV